jgi:hypothetical protein
MINGVVVKNEGVLVGGRNGVGPPNASRWSTHPLQDATKSKGSIERITEIFFFILYSSPSLYPA